MLCESLGFGSKLLSQSTSTRRYHYQFCLQQCVASALFWPQLKSFFFVPLYQFYQATAEQQHSNSSLCTFSCVTLCLETFRAHSMTFCTCVVCCVCMRVCTCWQCSDVLEHVHLLLQVEAEQAAEAAKMGLSGEVQPHDLAQIPVLWNVTNHESLGRQEVTPATNVTLMCRGEYFFFLLLQADKRHTTASICQVQIWTRGSNTMNQFCSRKLALAVQQWKSGRCRCKDEQWKSTRGRCGLTHCKGNIAQNTTLVFTFFTKSNWELLAEHWQRGKRWTQSICAWAKTGLAKHSSSHLYKNNGKRLAVYSCSHFYSWTLS